MSNTVAELDLDFDDLLSSAEINAGTDWEMSFIDSIQERYVEYGKGTYLSEPQLQTLKRIAGWD